MEEILVPIAVFGSLVLIVWTIMHYKAKVKAQSAAVITAMVNKGEPVTSDIIRSIGFAPKRRHGDLRTGLILLAIGAAMYIFGGMIPEEEGQLVFAGLASFPVLIAVALIAFWFFVSRKEQD